MLRGRMLTVLVVDDGTRMPWACFAVAAGQSWMDRTREGLPRLVS